MGPYRQGSLRKLGHGGKSVGTLTPGTTGRVRLDGIVLEKATDSLAVLPRAGCVSHAAEVQPVIGPNDQIGCVPFGAAIVTLRREPAR